MRRSRDRRRQGDVIVSIDIGPKVTADLVGLGWLPPSARGDKGVLVRALIDLIERAIEVRVTPAPSSQGKVGFMLEIQHCTIETRDRASLAPNRSAGRPRRNCQSLPPFRRPI